MKRKFYESWKFWFLIFTVLIITFFFIMENQSNKLQPSQDWSIAINSVEGAPRDYRKIDIISRPDGQGIVLAYIGDEGIQIYELDWFGQTERDLFIEEEVDSLRLLDIGFNDSTYHIYISDRLSLEKYDIDIDSFTYGNKVLVSETSEQFDASGQAVIVGNDDITEIIYKGEIVENITGYEDLKRANILYKDNKILASLDTVEGSSIIFFDGQSSQSLELISPTQEYSLGYIQDMHIGDDLITIISSKYRFGEDFPTSFGMWQLTEDMLELTEDDLELNNDFWYHNRTNLRPIISNVDGENVEYVLGLITRQDENKESVKAQPRLQDGTFTNILKFQINNSELVDYDRLTTTREYPVGYEYFKGEDGDILVWADRVGDYSNIKLAGNGDQWITYANENYEINYLEVFSEIMMSFVSSIIWGLIYAGIDLLKYIIPIIIFVIFLIIFSRLSKFKLEKKELILFVIVAIAISSFKFYTTAIANENLRIYGNIFPLVLGSDLVLGTISIITSIFSLFLINLWYSDNKDLSGNVHIFMYLFFEVYFYIFSIMVFVVSAMSKSAVMV